MTSSYHDPVLLKEATEGLVFDRDGIYIDGTLGGGGHSLAILDLLSSKGQLIGIDQDEEALREASAKLSHDHRFSSIKGNFGFTEVLISPALKGHISGILLDLGISSHQIDQPSRGFSFRHDGPLDMRMGSMTAQNAQKIVNDYDEQELARVIFQYGEERQSRAIARAIVASRPIHSTSELESVVRSVIKGKFVTKSLARVFQALRIEVNRELEMLERILEQAPSILGDSGRLSIISYHSLEDRMVKNYFRSGNVQGKVEKDFYGNPINPWSQTHRGVITPHENEIARNPRARSAKLRIAEYRPS